MDVIIWKDLKADIQDFFCPAEYKRRAKDDTINCVKYNLNYMQGYIIVFRLTASKVEKRIMDDKVFLPFCS